jgi:hypothetical protein
MVAASEPEPASGNVTLFVEAATLDLSPLPDPDGYRELAGPMQAWAGLLEIERDARFWYVIGCARRLDTAHRQFRRVGQDLDTLARPMAGRRPQDRLYERIAILGDAQLAVVALHRALAILTL